MPSVAQVIHLHSKVAEKIIPINELLVFEDSLDRATFAEVRRSPRLFSLMPGFKPNDYNPESAYWVKLTLHIPQPDDHQWLLEFYDQTIDHIEAYVPQDDGTYKRMVMGDMYNFNQKPFKHKNFEILLSSEFSGVRTFYFKIKSHSYADIRIAVRTIDRFVHYALKEYFLYGIFYGMIVIISLYNLLIFSAIREVKYLYYTFYILSVGVYAMCVDGIAYQFLWPGWPKWNQIAHGTALFSLIFWAMIFGQRFLNTRVRAPRLHKIIVGVLILRSAWYVHVLLFDNRLFEWRNIEIIPLSLIFYAGIDVWIRGYKPARFFVMAYGVLFLGFLIKALLNLSVIPFLILSYYSLHICFLLEMLFLTFALSDRVRILKDNRDRALKRIIIQHQENATLKDKVNKELEDLVTRRTKQLQEKNLLLEETNQKMLEQAKEINKINSMLDLDNWKLKNNIKEILQDRLVNKNLTLEQFEKIFPDPISCYRFLERLKWAGGYECSKCGNNKHSTGHTKFSRRCSKCGYDESVTSNTVFHRIKFPIEKAFYILYLTNNRHNHFTLDELSEMLDLRRNTIWTFKKKIESLYDGPENNHKSILINDLFSAHLA
ncbi:sensor histidine kinase [Fulvivirga imtechensis AK7]|uniref:Sensor histidine kinase n=2 Tax=Fulvivirga TaxID=396811 RepID=L8JMR9_9BACT|nr:sensor histidine kinase [Fulvivirga imtechensis AK7]